MVGVLTCLSVLKAQAGTLEDILARKSLKIGLDVGYIPFEMYDVDGRITGFDVELAQMLANELGVTVEFLKTPFDKLIEGLKEKKFDFVLSGVSITTRRSLDVNFSIPYHEIGQMVLVNKKSVGSAKSYEDIDRPNFKIYVQKGTTGHTWATQNFTRATVKPVQFIFEGASTVPTTALSAFVGDEPLVMAYHSRHPGKVAILGSTLTRENLAAAVRKGDHDLLSVINSFIYQIRGDGRLQRLKDKYLAAKKATGPAAKSDENAEMIDRLEKMERQLDRHRTTN